jgi:hypothetical protein
MWYESKKYGKLTLRIKKKIYLNLEPYWFEEERNWVIKSDNIKIKRIVLDFKIIW